MSNNYLDVARFPPPTRSGGFQLADSDTAKYEAALKKIDQLFDTAQPGTPEGEELDRLANWVVEYERRLMNED